LATECHYSQEYIDNMELQVVQEMSDYWAIEPPMSWMYQITHFDPKKSKAKKMTMFPQTAAATPWSKLPEHIKRGIIDSYIQLNPGKTEADFNADREAQVKQKYADRLKEAREKKAGN